tara:strand:- start:187 stop:540 length:354 start_codon:yes stop_codon:yes gene_type:complete
MKIHDELNKVFTESQQIQRCLAILYESNVTAWRNNVGMAKYDSKKGTRTVKFGHAGSSDILGYTNDGKFFAFEVKKYKKKPTQLQQHFIDNVCQNNGIASYGTANDLVDLLDKHELF